jgi:hypothetical protein
MTSITVSLHIFEPYLANRCLAYLIFCPDWTEDFVFYPDDVPNGMKIEETVYQWKCMTSFYARIPFLAESRAEGFYECKRAFELFHEPGVTGPLLEARLYGATEWIIESGEIWCTSIFSRSDTDLNDHDKRRFALGLLLKDSKISLFGKERVDFWRSRLVRFKEDWPECKLDEITPERLGRAITKLDGIIATVFPPDK